MINTEPLEVYDEDHTRHYLIKKVLHQQITRSYYSINSKMFYRLKETMWYQIYWVWND